MWTDTKVTLGKVAVHTEDLVTRREPILAEPVVEVSSISGIAIHFFTMGRTVVGNVIDLETLMVCLRTPTASTVTPTVHSEHRLLKGNVRFSP